MSRKICFIMSLVLAICALYCESVSKSYSARSLHNLARELTAQEGITETDEAEAKAKRQEFIQKGEMFGVCGMGFAALSLILWIVSGYHQHKRLWRFSPLILLVLYLFLLFVIV